MKKVLLTCLFLIIFITGCENKNVNKETTNDETNKQSENEMPQPTIDNAYEVKVKKLRFFIPSTLKVNQYNGYNLTYNYYLDTADEYCDLKVMLLSKSSYDNSIDKFMNSFVKAKDGKYTTEKINNATWYLGSSSSNIVTYTTISDDYFYNISLYVSRSKKICNTVNNMIKKTLFMTNEE